MRTVRLTEQQEKKLEALSRRKGVSRSRIIKDALEEYMAREESTKNSFELGASLFGRYGSGESDRSVTYKKRIADKISDKNERERQPGQGRSTPQ